MSDSFTGGCQCGAERYEFSGEPCFVEIAIAAIASAQATVPTFRPWGCRPTL